MRVRNIRASSLACRERAGLSLKLTYLPTGEGGDCSSPRDHKSPGIICFSISYTQMEISSVQPSGPEVLYWRDTDGQHGASWNIWNSRQNMFNVSGRDSLAYLTFLKESMPDPPTKKMLRITTHCGNEEGPWIESISFSCRLGGQEQRIPSLFLNHESRSTYTTGNWTNTEVVLKILLKVGTIPGIVPCPPAHLVSFTLYKATMKIIFKCYRWRNQGSKSGCMSHSCWAILSWIW